MSQACHMRISVFRKSCFSPGRWDLIFVTRKIAWTFITLLFDSVCLYNCYVHFTASLKITPTVLAWRKNMIEALCKQGPNFLFLTPLSLSLSLSLSVFLAMCACGRNVKNFCRRDNWKFGSFGGARRDTKKPEGRREDSWYKNGYFEECP